MSDPAFVGAGQKPGLEIWRIEKLSPVKLPKVANRISYGDTIVAYSVFESHKTF
jgi:hypothetical protein